MRVFIGVATSDTQYTKSLCSIFEMKTREGDKLFFPDRFGQGTATRMLLEAAFFNSKEFDALLMLDADQVHDIETLEKLRESMEEKDLDMVCAHYYKRNAEQIESLCHVGESYPFFPMLHPPTEGLHEIAETGLGCVLIKRKVIEGVRSLLPDGISAFSPGSLPDVEDIMFGQDFRFFALAKSLGYKLWLRADLESLHATTIFLNHRNASKLLDGHVWADQQHNLLMERIKRWGMSLEAFRQRKLVVLARKEELKKQYDELSQKAEKDEQDKDNISQLSIALFQMDGRLLEIGAWIEWEEKYPRIKRPDQLPVNKPLSPDYPMEVVSETREQVYQEVAKEIMDLVPEKDSGNGNG